MTTIRINESLLLWAIGVIQPAAPDEILRFIEQATQSSLPIGGGEGIEDQCLSFLERGLVQVVNKKRKWFSLTYAGDIRIPKALRRRRDRIRLFLLKNAWKSRIGRVGELPQKLIDDSSIVKGSDLVIQEVPRPTKSCVRGSRVHERFRWPRIFEQISNGSGSVVSSPTLTVPYNSLQFYNFGSSHREEKINPYPINAKELALAIGISARLLTAIVRNSEKYYRRFQIPKADGTARDIASPRLFLKVIQYWIKDYLLFRLPVHEACHSFLKDVSIEDNARFHIGKRFVGTIDVEDFFGSISQRSVQSLLSRSGHTKALSSIIAKLVTLDNSLPQGAPTSPIISNSYLFGFDRAMQSASSTRGCVYTRYADDITISGDDVESVMALMARATVLLKRLDLRLKSSKTRIQSRGGRQIVTGLTVNDIAQPSREQRRKVRAMLHRYKNGLINEPKDIASLRGWLSYLRSFEHLRGRFPAI